ALRAGRGNQPADHPLLSPVVAHAAPGREHRADGLDHRQFYSLAVATDDGGLHLSVRRSGPDAHPGRAGRDQGRGKAAPNGCTMNPWLFVIAAYGVAIALTVALLLWA